MLKKLSIGSFISVFAAVVILVGFILGIVTNAVQGYPVNAFAGFVVAEIGAILLIGGSIFLSFRRGNKLACYLPLFVATVCAGIGFALVIASRTELVGTLWVTALDSTNPLAVKAMNTGTVSFVCNIVAMLLLVVSGFFPLAKEDKAE